MLGLSFCIIGREQFGKIMWHNIILLPNPLSPFFGFAVLIVLATLFFKEKRKEGLFFCLLTFF